MIINRRTLIGACLALLLGAGLFLMLRTDSVSQPQIGADFALFADNTALPGDANADGKLSDREAEDLAATEKTSAIVTKKIGAKKGVNTVVVTPAGDLWWRFISGLSVQTATWAASAPDARWYAYTEGRAYNSAAQHEVPYDALHVAFKTRDAAIEWAEVGAADGSLAAAGVKIRGALLTLTPSWVDIGFEPYRDIEKLDLGDTEVRIAHWQVNFTEQVALRADESVLPKDYRKAFDYLGFGGKNVSWVATSAAPNAIWRGTISGFHPKKVNIVNALATLNVSFANCAKYGRFGCAGGQGLTDGVPFSLMSDPSGTEGGEGALRPEHAPRDADLLFVMGRGWRGAMTGSAFLDQSPIESIAMWITDRSVLAIQPVVEPQRR